MRQNSKPMPSVLVSVDAGVETITLNRPEKLNALNPEMHAQLRAALERATDDPQTRALLVTGAGRGFCTGQDLAEQWGLIWKAVDDERLADEALALAQTLASGPTKGYGLLKKAMYASAGNSLDAQLDLERDLQREAGLSEDYREGVSAFKEKRMPRFKGK